MTFPCLAGIAAVVVPVAVLTGCAATAVNTSAPSPSDAANPAASSTPSKAGPSSLSDGERYAAILPAYNASWAAIDQLQAAGGVGAPTPAMKNTMTDAHLAYWNTQAAQWRAEGRSYTGRNRVVDAEVRATSFSPTTATAEVQVCVDLSTVQAFAKDGTPLRRTTKPNLSGTVAMFWSGGHWRTDGFIDGTGGYVDRC